MYSAQCTVGRRLSKKRRVEAIGRGDLECIQLVNRESCATRRAAFSIVRAKEDRKTCLEYRIDGYALLVSEVDSSRCSSTQVGYFDICLGRDSKMGST